MEKNGINKEIRMSREFAGAKSKSLVNEIRRLTGTDASLPRPARPRKPIMPPERAAFSAPFQAAVTTTASPSAARRTLNPQACANKRV